MSDLTHQSHESHGHHTTLPVEPSEHLNSPIMPIRKDYEYDSGAGLAKSGGILNNMSPKSAFIAGLIGGVLTLCTVGFFILLVVMLKGGIPAFGAGNIKGANQDAVGAIKPTGNQGDTGSNPVGSLPPLNNRDHVRGNARAPLTLVEYSDYECPFCKSFHPTVQRMMTEYGDKIKWVYRHYPLTSIHQNAEKEAEASECVAELAGNDAFWKFTDTIFERTTSQGTGFALTALPGLAAEVGADQKKFEACLSSGKYQAYVQDNESGGLAAGVQGTPGSILVDSKGKPKMISGAVSYSELKASIDAALAAQ